MSYDIYIGQAKIESSWDDDDTPRAEWVVGLHTHPKAPNKPDMTGQGNSCHPGYGQWADAMRTVGLFDLWFDEGRGLLREHPGCQRLTAEHLIEVERAQAAYLAAHPNEKPGMCECVECVRFPPPPADKSQRPPHDPTLNFNMLRLEWMAWWMRWTLENCTRPAVANH